MSTNNIQSNKNIYTLATISEALECTSVPGVMTLRLDTTIKVRASEWRDCLLEISESCAVKWIIHNSNKQPTDITAEEAKDSAMRVVQKRTKKNKCSALLHVRGFFKMPEWYEITLTKDHTEHTPGDVHKDIHTLPLAKKYLHELSQQLEQSSKSASQIRIDMLRAIDRYRRNSECKVNYYDIWNLMNKINKTLYHFDKDEMISFMIWINEKLPAMNFSIFKANTSYSPSLNVFACGFMSPIQQNKMKNAASFCLHATYGISEKIDKILYTLLIRDEEIGRGWPVAYMITNDRDRLQNKRLNKLVFILVYDVEYYLSQEYNRVISNNGAMSAFTRKQRIRKIEAEEVDDDEREARIVAPNSVDSRQWQVQSFVDQNTAYVVEVSDTNTIISCTCFDFKRRYRPCKHMYLLKMHTSNSIFFSTTSAITTNQIHTPQTPQNTENPSNRSRLFLTSV
ncbi:hypothetical protein PHYBLDRAFT_63502 [Phycomyces blakesleeanus NRRL 1555(-)]|uniref:SWIM-type domain-containing protein n=1 Tax=Phycomyces blakesleeanus (strain ATCC 8743b / DSM 1359 / FGSC 10004 / NBRC 33097 / NRRL 1555) TaxID=763407 RepID=A0A167KPQ2_PHYB8|nr:hypothetical protein PHYBLDRAFT_63502 [Phycomyces blakesleeanus NRRL 1555(-)]OAD68589.1 hypothetical protein PHYBLDRAFT_63502 [Phycomyces blakesleeanus NRRL 1555(-)]|eukprot:XP_018286629.1 hypothetical protein PHYBLDRAFT_63502 [Phycomyces blakesleeanus NRRL 1555(-)]